MKDGLRLGCPSEPHFFLLRTAPDDHQPPTADRQPLAADRRPPPPTANRRPPPTATHCSIVLLWSCVLPMPCPWRRERPRERSFLFASQTPSPPKGQPWPEGVGGRVAAPPPPPPRLLCRSVQNRHLATVVPFGRGGGTVVGGRPSRVDGPRPRAGARPVHRHGASEVGPMRCDVVLVPSPTHATERCRATQSRASSTGQREYTSALGGRGQGCIGRGGGIPPPPSRRPAYAQPLSP